MVFTRVVLASILLLVVLIQCPDCGRNHTEISVDSGIGGYILKSFTRLANIPFCGAVDTTMDLTPDSSQRYRWQQTLEYVVNSVLFTPAGYLDEQQPLLQTSWLGCAQCQWRSLYERTKLHLAFHIHAIGSIYQGLRDRYTLREQWGLLVEACRQRCHDWYLIQCRQLEGWWIRATTWPDIFWATDVSDLIVVICVILIHLRVELTRLPIAERASKLLLAVVGLLDVTIPQPTASVVLLCISFYYQLRPDWLLLVTLFCHNIHDRKYGWVMLWPRMAIVLVIWQRYGDQMFPYNETFSMAINASLLIALMLNIISFRDPTYQYTILNPVVGVLSVLGHAVGYLLLFMISMLLGLCCSVLYRVSQVVVVPWRLLSMLILSPLTSLFCQHPPTVNHCRSIISNSTVNTAGKHSIVTTGKLVTTRKQLPEAQIHSAGRRLSETWQAHTEACPYQAIIDGPGGISGAERVTLTDPSSPEGILNNPTSQHSGDHHGTECLALCYNTRRQLKATCDISIDQLICWAKTSMAYEIDEVRLFTLALAAIWFGCQRLFRDTKSTDNTSTGFSRL